MVLYISHVRCVGLIIELQPRLRFFVHTYMAYIYEVGTTEVGETGPEVPPLLSSYEIHFKGPTGTEFHPVQMSRVRNYSKKRLPNTALFDNFNFEGSFNIFEIFDGVAKCLKDYRHLPLQMNINSPCTGAKTLRVL